MTEGSEPHAYCFCGINFDTRHLTLTACLDGEAACYRLSAAEGRLLAFFLRHLQIAHSKETLISVAWLGRPVSTSSLPVAIANLRRYLSSFGQNDLIRTLPRQGYLFALSPAQLSCADLPDTHLPADDDMVFVAPPDSAEALEMQEESITQASPLSVDKKEPVNRCSKRQYFYWSALGLFWLILLVFIIYLSAVWVDVDCQPVGGGTVCKTQRAASVMPSPKKGEVWLMIGDQQVRLEESHYEKK
ncbi:MAG TPA: hypothetical protein DCF97_01090 [Plesiomonas shigelloides]|nr:hypothetical protein [Plesiomonas shigelloides]